MEENPVARMGRSCIFGPISIDLIEENLYLGGLAAAGNIDVLNKYKITHILTIDTHPLPRSICEQKHITTMFVQLSDQPKEDLLTHFHATNEFIQEGLSKGVVLVHCYFGVSRSAAVIIAYIMKKYEKNFKEAYQIVQDKRSIVFPNQGFVAQLKLYKEMDYTIDTTNMNYKIYRLNLAADTVKKVQILPPNFLDLIQPDPGTDHIQPNPRVYRCKTCRRVLASDNNLILHKDKEENDDCRRVYFIEPMAWMNCVYKSEGKLHCPKCDLKVGSFSWVTGRQCPCGIKVAPSFYLIASKVDFSNVVKNIEVTC